MVYRRLLLIWLLSCALSHAYAQTSYQQTDTATLAQYKAGNWQQLISTGKQSVANHINFPVLQMRMGYAYFMTGNYSAALSYYEQILDDDPRNQVARFYGYLCNTYLNRTGEASYHASYLDSTMLPPSSPKAFGVIQAGVESSFKTNTDYLRGNATFNRISLANRLGWKLQLDQSLMYYNQQVIPRMNDRPGRNDSQYEYFGKLNYSLSNRFSVLGAYHYLHTDFLRTAYKSNIVIAGVKYAAPYLTLQTDANVGYITGSHIQQYNGQATVYPTGTLNLYTTSRVSLLHQSDGSRCVFGQLVGFKTLSDLWLEANVTFGNLNNYLESDGLYVYNAIDDTKFKTGGTAYYQLSHHLLVYVNYTYERKQETYKDITYKQYSTTGGVTWKF